MDISSISVAIIIIISTWVVIALLYILFYPKHEKGIRISKERPDNSDCDIDFAVENIEILEEEKYQNVQQKKLR